MSDCIHTWVEGGNRDRGRYHCSLCFECLSVPGMLARITKLEGTLLATDKDRSAALAKLAEAERVVALARRWGKARAARIAAGKTTPDTAAEWAAFTDACDELIEATEAMTDIADALAAGGE
jgi:hypothetical protein